MSTISESDRDTDASYEIRADRTENTLYLDFAGSLTAETMRTAADETVEAAERLDDGFGIINDISEFTPPSPEAAKPIQEAQATLKELGVGDVVRVVADETSAVTENAFQRRSREAGYGGKTATTMSEAERKLES
ncbi:hypothetical protein [Haloarcula sediminis]|uniref:hypothetical protein n=1 Tax=Haloarcula sediminis TaxID=3111777 RepID=UPI002D799007|nr:hypothetical protein [Haloarcula sp. CK38]